MSHFPDYIHIYNEGASSSLDIQLLAQYISEKTGRAADIRGSLIPAEVSNQKSLAEKFAQIKIIDPQKKELNPDPLPVEVAYEYKVISTQKPSWLLYDGFCLQEIFSKLILPKEHNLKHLHIIFTSRLFGTFADSRYHIRVALFSFPTIISTAGIVEAPAKPREFYLKKQLGINHFTLKDEFRGRFIDYDDARLTEVLKGYLMQALFFHLTGNPFCEDLNCKLYNAHWQEEVINAQIKSSYEFCEEHSKILEKYYRLGSVK